MTSEYQSFLAHYGIKGQKWGERRFQNPDGSLTPEGEKRYGVGEKKRHVYQNKDGTLTEEGKERYGVYSKDIERYTKRFVRSKDMRKQMYGERQRERYKKFADEQRKKGDDLTKRKFVPSGDTVKAINIGLNALLIGVTAVNITRILNGLGTFGIVGKGGPLRSANNKVTSFFMKMAKRSANRKAGIVLKSKEFSIGKYFNKLG